MCTPGPVVLPVKKASSTPTRVSRHSSVSAPPVDTAMFGMLAYAPSLRFLGKLILPAEFDVHCVTDGRVISLRHLPICTTSGICAPSGTLFSVKFPAVSVSAYVIGSPEKSASHEQEVLLTPMGMGWS